MKILVLNEDLVQALRAHNLPLTCVVDFDAFHKHFSSDDYDTMISQTIMCIAALKKVLPARVVEGLTCAAEFEDDVMAIARKLEALTEDQCQALIEEFTPHLSSLSCAAVDANTAILYADPSTLESGRRTLENIFCAMALIMPVGAVMKTELYERYVQTL